MGQLTLTICSLQANLDNCLLNQYIQRAHRATNLNHFFVFMILWIIKLHFKICVRGRHHSVSPAMFCRFFSWKSYARQTGCFCVEMHTHTLQFCTCLIDWIEDHARLLQSSFISVGGRAVSPLLIPPWSPSTSRPGRCTGISDQCHRNHVVHVVFDGFYRPAVRFSHSTSLITDG